MAGAALVWLDKKQKLASVVAEPKALETCWTMGPIEGADSEGCEAVI